MPETNKRKESPVKDVPKPKLVRQNAQEVLFGTPSKPNAFGYMVPFLSPQVLKGKFLSKFGYDSQFNSIQFELDGPQLEELLRIDSLCQEDCKETYKPVENRIRCKIKRSYLFSKGGTPGQKEKPLEWNETNAPPEHIYSVAIDLKGYWVSKNGEAHLYATVLQARPMTDTEIVPEV